MFRSTHHGSDDEHDDLGRRIENQVRRWLKRQRSDEPDGEDKPVVRGYYSPARDGSRRKLRWAGVIAVAMLGLLGAADPDVRETVRDWLDGSTPPQGREVIYAQHEVRVREKPGTDYKLVRNLNPGDRVEVARGDLSGWVLLYEHDGRPIGYAYRTRASFGPKPPEMPALLIQSVASVGGGSSRTMPPAAAASPGDTTAICRDGMPSFSTHAGGTCSNHGGVLCWVNHPGQSPPTSSPFCTSLAARREEQR